MSVDKRVAGWWGGIFIASLTGLSGVWGWDSVGTGVLCFFLGMSASILTVAIGDGLLEFAIELKFAEMDEYDDDDDDVPQRQPVRETPVRESVTRDRTESDEDLSSLISKLKAARRNGSVEAPSGRELERAGVVTDRGSNGRKLMRYLIDNGFIYEIDKNRNAWTSAGSQMFPKGGTA